MAETDTSFKFKVVGGEEIVIEHIIVEKSPFVNGIAEVLIETDGDRVIDVSDKISRLTITQLNEFYRQFSRRRISDTERITYMIYKSYPYTEPLRMTHGTKTEIIDTPMTIKYPEEIYTRHLIYITDGEICDNLCQIKKDSGDASEEFADLMKVLKEVSFIGGCDEFRGYIIYRIVQHMTEQHKNERNRQIYEQYITQIRTQTDGDIAEIIDAIPFAYVEKIADDIYGEHNADYEFLDEHKFDEKKDDMKSDEETTKRINSSIKHRMVKRYGYNKYFIYNVIANGTLEELKMCHNEDVNLKYIFQEIFVAIINGKTELMNYLLERLRYVKHTHTEVNLNILQCQKSGTISANTYTFEENQGTTDNFVPSDINEPTYQDTDERDDKTISCYNMFVRNVKQDKGRIRDDEFEELCNLIVTHSNSYNLIKKKIGYDEFNKNDRVIERAVCGYRYRIMHEIFSRGAIVNKSDNTPYYTDTTVETNDMRMFDTVYGYIRKDRFACNYLISVCITTSAYDMYVKAMECGLWRSLDGNTGQEICKNANVLFELAEMKLMKKPDEMKRQNLERMKKHFESCGEMITSYVPNRKEIFETNL
jgi:hypothetical protein